MKPDHAPEAVGSTRAGEEMFRRLLESAPDAMVIVDHRGEIVVVNAETEKLFGYRREELLGKPVDLLVPERLRQAHAGHRQRFAAEPRTRPMGAELELYGRRQDGTEFPVQISLSPLDTEQGMLVSTAIRDITEQKRAEQELKRYADALARSNADLEQFAHLASHDLQAPLRSVAGFCQLLEKHYGDQFDERGKQWLRFIIKDARNMQALVQGLLRFSRLETKAKPFEQTEASAAVERALANLRSDLEESGGQVTRGSLPAVTADPDQLAEVFQNLIGNALKYRGDRVPRIHVDAERQRDEWVFSVRDNGIGIDRRFHERIFVMSQRLHLQEEYSGTGIGLTLCERIVERHGGRIWLESTPGEGSVFSFTVPVRGRR